MFTLPLQPLLYLTPNTPPPAAAAAVGLMQLWLIISLLIELAKVNQMLVVRGQLHALCLSLCFS